MRITSLVSLSLVLVACGDKDGSSDDTAAAVVDADADGYDADADCDDSSGAIYPGADESCDGADNDCDDLIDEEPTDGALWYGDGDGDGFGDADSEELGCTAPSGTVSNSEDCDDADSAVHPAASEVCNEIDDDCDGAIDNDDPEGVADGEAGYPDEDGDGFGDSDQPGTWCGGTLQDGDCDDADPSAYPGAEELCDEADNDCDGDVDEITTSYPDADGDGYGDDASASTDCEAPSGYVQVGGDCDDADPTVNPDGVEICDDADNDCDGDIDVLLYEDFDAKLEPGVWSLNGDASQVWAGADGYLQLNPAASSQVGSAFLIELVDGQSWAASFDLEISSTSGADGMTLAFLDETDPTLLGSNGGNLGINGFDGYAFEWDTYNNSGVDPVSSDHVGLIETYDRTSLDYATGVSFAGVGPVYVEVFFDAGVYELWMDGALVLDGVIADYALKEILFGFTGSTGAVTEEHAIDDLTLSCN